MNTDDIFEAQIRELPDGDHWVHLKFHPLNIISFRDEETDFIMDAETVLSPGNCYICCINIETAAFLDDRKIRLIPNTLIWCTTTKQFLNYPKKTWENYF